MALLKQIASEYGFTLEYWRVVRIDVYVNSHIDIFLNGYISEADRMREDEYDGTSNSNVYIEGKVVTIEYAEDVDVVDAYEYLKSLADFVGSLDV